VKIKGTYKGEVIARCCSKEKWHKIYVNRGSGSIYCEHQDVDTNFDYLDMNKLKEIKDKKIIKEIEEYEEEQNKQLFVKF